MSANSRYRIEEKKVHSLKSTVNSIINANGIGIRISSTKEADYISLTDIAKKSDPENPRYIIQNWMRTKNTIEFLGLWEIMHNVDFNRVEFDAFKNEAGSNAFVLRPQLWFEKTNAIGITSKAGRYGGTYAHADIAFEFASWISPAFKLYIIKDYQRLKADESHSKAIEWNVKREIAKTNYRIHTDAIKDNLLPPNLSRQAIAYTYASEADIINMALFGMTAKDWREQHKEDKGNIRDTATIEQLIILSNLETMNAQFIKEGLPQDKRLEQLNQIAQYQMKSLLSNTPKSIERLKELQK